MIINFVNVNKKYNRVIALKDINIRLGEGLIGVVGLNGAGKSTFLRVAAGIERADAGKIFSYDAEEYEEYRIRIKSFLGYLPQNFGIYKHFSVEEFLRYFCVLKCIPEISIKSSLDYVYELMNIAKLRNIKMLNISTGEKKRIGIAAALLNDPVLLILDEPMTGLDVDERISFKNHLLSMGKERTVLISSSVLEDIEDICEKVVVLKKGEKVYYGDTAIKEWKYLL